MSKVDIMLELQSNGKYDEQSNLNGDCEPFLAFSVI